MSKSEKYLKDEERFITLFSSFTKIPKTKLRDFLKENNIKTLIEHPTSLNLTERQYEKLYQLLEVEKLYTRLSELEGTYILDSPQKAYSYFKGEYINQYDKEYLAVAYLNTKNEVIESEIIHMGSINASVASPQTIFTKALRYDAASVFISHNHPSGDPRPSQQDISSTQKIVAAGKVIGINVLDHLIMGRSDFVSLRQKDPYMFETNLNTLREINQVQEGSENMVWKKMTKVEKENYRKEKQKQTEKLIKDLDKKIDEFREMKIDSPEYKEFLKKISKFHNYSLNNLLLISLQNPNATFVAGYKTWQKEFNRQVVKGSKGIKILAPRIYKKEPETKAEIEEAKKLGVDKIERLYFNTINVFDVSDTKGEEFYLTPASPIMAKDKTPEDLDIIQKSIESLYEHYGVELEYVSQEELGYTTNGAYYLAEHKVLVSKDNTKEQQISTLIHEFTHSQLHSFDKMLDEHREGEVINGNIREIQAQSISYAVCDFIGIDNSEYTFDYLGNWGNSSNEELKQSLNIILKNSNKYINQIEDLIIEKTLEKENDKEVAIYSDKYKCHIKSEKIKYIEKYIPGMDSKEAKDILTNSSEIVVFTDDFKELEIDIKDHKIINQFGRGSSTDEPFIIEIENDNSKKTFIVDKNFKERRKSINEKQKDIEKENIKKSYEKLKKEYER